MPGAAHGPANPGQTPPALPKLVSSAGPDRRSITDHFVAGFGRDSRRRRVPITPAPRTMTFMASSAIPKMDIESPIRVTRSGSRCRHSALMLASLTICSYFAISSLDVFGEIVRRRSRSVRSRARSSRSLTSGRASDLGHLRLQLARDQIGGQAFRAPTSRTTRRNRSPSSPDSSTVGNFGRRSPRACVLVMAERLDACRPCASGSDDSIGSASS